MLAKLKAAQEEARPVSAVTKRPATTTVSCDIKLHPHMERKF
jgi:hypothetical protein